MYKLAAKIVIFSERRWTLEAISQVKVSFSSEQRICQYSISKTENPQSHNPFQKSDISEMSATESRFLNDTLKITVARSGNSDHNTLIIPS